MSVTGLWYIACQSPVPSEIPQIHPGSRGFIMLGSPAVYAVGGKKGKLDKSLPVYWVGREPNGRYFGGEWTSNQSICMGYEAKEEAEEAAFNLAAKRPWLLGHLYVTTLK